MSAPRSLSQLPHVCDLRVGSCDLLAWLAARRAAAGGLAARIWLAARGCLGALLLPGLLPGLLRVGSLANGAAHRNTPAPSNNPC